MGMIERDYSTDVVQWDDGGGPWDFKEGWKAMERCPRLLLRLGELIWGCLTNRQGCYTTNSAARTTMKGAL